MCRKKEGWELGCAEYIHQEEAPKEQSLEQCKIFLEAKKKSLAHKAYRIPRFLYFPFTICSVYQTCCIHSLFCSEQFIFTHLRA